SRLPACSATSSTQPCRRLRRSRYPPRRRGSGSASPASMLLRRPTSSAEESSLAPERRPSSQSRSVLHRSPTPLPSPASVQGRPHALTCRETAASARSEEELARQACPMKAARPQSRVALRSRAAQARIQGRVTAAPSGFHLRDSAQDRNPEPEPPALQAPRQTLYRKNRQGQAFRRAAPESRSRVRSRPRR